MQIKFVTGNILKKKFYYFIKLGVKSFFFFFTFTRHLFIIFEPIAVLDKIGLTLNSKKLSNEPRPEAFLVLSFQNFNFCLK